MTTLTGGLTLSDNFYDPTGSQPITQDTSGANQLLGTAETDEILGQAVKNYDQYLTDQYNSGQLTYGSYSTDEGAQQNILSTYAAQDANLTPYQINQMYPGTYFLSAATGTTPTPTTTVQTPSTDNAVADNNLKYAQTMALLAQAQTPQTTVQTPTTTVQTPTNNITDSYNNVINSNNSVTSSGTTPTTTVQTPTQTQTQTQSQTAGGNQVQLPSPFNPQSALQQLTYPNPPTNLINTPLQFGTQVPMPNGPLFNIPTTSNPSINPLVMSGAGQLLPPQEQAQQYPQSVSIPGVGDIPLNMTPQGGQAPQQAPQGATAGQQAAAQMGYAPFQLSANSGDTSNDYTPQQPSYAPSTVPGSGAHSDWDETQRSIPEAPPPQHSPFQDMNPIPPGQPQNGDIPAPGVNMPLTPGGMPPQAPSFNRPQAPQPAPQPGSPAQQDAASALQARDKAVSRAQAAEKARDDFFEKYVLPGAIEAAEPHWDTLPDWYPRTAGYDNPETGQHVRGNPLQGPDMVAHIAGMARAQANQIGGNRYQREANYAKAFNYLNQVYGQALASAHEAAKNNRGENPQVKYAQDQLEKQAADARKDAEDATRTWNEANHIAQAEAKQIADASKAAEQQELNRIKQHDLEQHRKDVDAFHAKQLAEKAKTDQANDAFHAKQLAEKTKTDEAKIKDSQKRTQIAETDENRKLTASARQLQRQMILDKYAENKDARAAARELREANMAPFKLSEIQAHTAELQQFTSSSQGKDERAVAQEKRDQESFELSQRLKRSQAESIDMNTWHKMTPAEKAVHVAGAAGSGTVNWFTKFFLRQPDASMRDALKARLNMLKMNSWEDER